MSDACNVRPMAKWVRITRRDWEIINEALALLEAEVDQDRNDIPLLDGVRSVRRKVHTRLERTDG